jgi:3-deoxy-D-arabino-heptulosonate 7-phosphate (DAHP) synthase
MYQQNKQKEMKKVLQHESISDWFPARNKPFMISGPCSAETEEQMVATAKQIAATGKVHALRAGIWKPRTRPGQYEGAGQEGLDMRYYIAGAGRRQFGDVVPAEHEDEGADAVAQSGGKNLFELGEGAYGRFLDALHRVAGAGPHGRGFALEARIPWEEPA